MSEVMIGLLLASFLLTALIKQYLRVKHQSSRFIQNIEQQMDTQMVIDLIRRSIRHAGYTPCRPINQLTTASSIEEFSKIRAITIDEKNNHYVDIQRMANRYAVVSHIKNIQQVSVKKKFFHEGQVVAVTDCFHAEIMKIAHIVNDNHYQLITFSNSLQFSYPRTAYIGEWLKESYFIGQSTNQKASLFYKGKRSEALSHSIHGFTVDVLEREGRQLLTIQLESNYGKTTVFSTTVRS